MSGGFSLINIDGKFTEPATVLITKISDAVGSLFRPTQIRRVAEAESEAAIIEAQAQIEVTSLQHRAFTRLISEEAKKQNNIETIIEKAIPQLTDSSNPQDMQDDWITNFFDKCRIISDDEMQSLWARILSSEANSPGTFSRRTVNSLGSLDKSDAQLFAAFCGFLCLIEGELVPLIYHMESSITGAIGQSIYEDNGIKFTALAHLSSIGLISLEPLGYSQTELSQQIDIAYYDATIRVEFSNPENNQLDSGNALLTAVGKELARVCGSKPVDGFVDYAIKAFTQMGLAASSPYPTQDT